MTNEFSISIVYRTTNNIDFTHSCRKTMLVFLIDDKTFEQFAKQIESKASLMLPNSSNAFLS